MLVILENYYYKRIPKNRFDKYKHHNLSGGSSFLASPLRLFASKADIAHKTQYLVLASKRDYLHYAVYGITYLDLSFWPDIMTDKLYGNPLIEVKDNKIHFLLEN